MMRVREHPSLCELVSQALSALTSRDGLSRRPAEAERGRRRVFYLADTHTAVSCKLTMLSRETEGGKIGNKLTHNASVYIHV